ATARTGTGVSGECDDPANVIAPTRSHTARLQALRLPRSLLAGFRRQADRFTDSRPENGPALQSSSAFGANPLRRLKAATDQLVLRGRRIRTRPCWLFGGFIISIRPWFV